MTSRVMCAKCVMDTTDPEITFDGQGVCHHCRRYDLVIERLLSIGSRGQERLGRLVEAITRNGKGKEYDCVIGISGGVDSTYALLKVRQLGLRPLAIHLDNGWDPEPTVKNIQQALDHLGVELFTHVLDWDEFRDLQLAFLKASTPDSEIPTDHAINAVLNNIAARFHLDFIVTGSNVRTESHLPRQWSQGHSDWKYIQSVHERFGTVPLRTFPHLGFRDQCWFAIRKGYINILNYFEYVRRDAVRELQQEFGWQDYGAKHQESIYTRFYQGVLLPKKFGFDKRRSHLSSLICSGEITREDALRELEKPPYPMEQQESDFQYVAKKLGLSDDELARIFAEPPKRFQDYPSYDTPYYHVLGRGLRYASALYKHATGTYEIFKN
jgi:N-acetyl sugar amidotransferase